MTSLGGARSTGAVTSTGGATLAIAGGTNATGGWTSSGGMQSIGGTLIGILADSDWHCQLQSTKTNWVLFSIWTAPYYQSPSNSVDHLKAVYTSDYVITLDEMPGF